MILSLSHHFSLLFHSFCWFLSIYKAPGTELWVNISSHLHYFVDPHMILDGSQGGHFHFRGGIILSILWVWELKLEEVILCKSWSIVFSNANATANMHKKFICARWRKYFTRYILCGEPSRTSTTWRLCVPTPALVPTWFLSRQTTSSLGAASGPALPWHACWVMPLYINICRIKQLKQSR